MNVGDELGGGDMSCPLKSVDPVRRREPMDGNWLGLKRPASFSLQDALPGLWISRVTGLTQSDVSDGELKVFSGGKLKSKIGVVKKGAVL